MRTHVSYQKKKKKKEWEHGFHTAQLSNHSLYPFNIVKRLIWQSQDQHNNFNNVIKSFTQPFNVIINE